MESRTKNLTQVKHADRRAKAGLNDVAGLAQEAKVAAMESVRSGYEAARRKVVTSARATDDAIHASPYYSMGIAFGTGLLLGFLIKRR